MSPAKPQTSYHWALDPSSGDYYRVNGYWWSGSIVALKNMFYSDVAQDTLAAVCQKTLAAKGINRPVALSPPPTTRCPTTTLSGARTAPASRRASTS
ncbi:hypothetical protein JOS77_11395 [Chromobacterium haemolyticum]|nr:hypothetical protein JOS77_11395 [Chromobacterium haemolyticum]